MGKLLKESGRVKTVLSANSGTFAQIENVMEDIDFRTEVSREEMIKMNGEFFERVTKPVKVKTGVKVDF